MNGSLRKRRGCAALLLLPWVCIPSARADEPTLIDHVEAQLPPYVAAAVMAIDDGKTVFKHAWGKRRHDRPEPCTMGTNFRLASVTKHFTATTVLLLVDRGVITTNDTLDRFFPGSPDYWKEITVHHLLTHTSGLPDYEKLIPEGTTLQLTDLNVLALLRETTEPIFEPGTKFAYSNSGYTLLGLIVEAVAGRPFHRFMQTEVFAPVGMNRSVLFVAGMNSISDRAFGHELVADGKWMIGDQSVTSAVRGDGGVYSSLDDLERWLAALNGDFLLSKSSSQAMFTPHVKTDRGEQHYGYGWFIGSYRGERRVMHAGGTRGFSLMLQRFPDRRAAVVILLNRSESKPSGKYVERIVDRLLFERGEKLDSAALPDAGEAEARGMRRFRNNEIAGSIRDFRRAAELDPRTAPHLWQLGISHYYAGDFKRGRQQFESHQAVNRHDVENATWHFICVARIDGVEAARKKLLKIDFSRDSRVPMSEVYQFYAGLGSEDAVLEAAKRADTELARMYAHLYLGLYYEAAGDRDQARRHMREAVSAKLKNNYMHDVAKVHLLQRKWNR